MTPTLPNNAPEIYVAWWTICGGLGLTAFTNETGTAHIGLYRVNLEGVQITAPIYFERSRLMARILVGYARKGSVIAFVDAEVTTRGIDARITIPSRLEMPTSSHQVRARWTDHGALYRPDDRWKLLTA